METDRRPSGDFLADPTFPTDLVPIYALTEQQYQMIINNLSNLIVEVIKQLHEADNINLAAVIASYAREILLDYDEDVAEHIQFLLGRD